MREIDLKGWKLFSDRRNSQNYISEDGKWMLKTAPAGSEGSVADFELEQKMSEAVRSLGLPTPQVDDIVRLADGGYGLIFEYIEDKISIARAIGQDPEHVDYYMKKFIDIGKSIHMTECDTEKFSDADAFIRGWINDDKLYLTDIQKRKMLAVIDTLEKKTTCLHGDFQTGNVITSKQGDYLIDLGSFSYGNPMYDLGEWYFFTHIIPFEEAKRIFHIESEELRKKMWDLAIKYYFGVSDSEIPEITEKIAPFGLIGTINTFRNVVPGDGYRFVVKACFDKLFANIEA